jgi:hypothetical protein
MEMESEADGHSNYDQGFRHGLRWAKRRKVEEVEAPAETMCSLQEVLENHGWEKEWTTSEFRNGFDRGLKWANNTTMTTPMGGYDTHATRRRQLHLVTSFFEKGYNDESEYICYFDGFTAAQLAVALREALSIYCDPLMTLASKLAVQGFYAALRLVEEGEI